MSEHSNEASANKSELVEDLDTPEEDAENVKGGARTHARGEAKERARGEGRVR
jgi:hypothetical protein